MWVGYVILPVCALVAGWLMRPYKPPRGTEASERG